jgi:hypothetical protein
VTRPLRADQRHLVASAASNALRRIRRDMPARDELAIARAAERRRAAADTARAELEARQAADARVAEETLRNHVGCKGERCTRPGCRGGVPAPGPRRETDLLDLPHVYCRGESCKRPGCTRSRIAEPIGPRKEQLARTHAYCRGATDCWRCKRIRERSKASTN